MTIVSVPETPVGKENRPPLRKHKIGTTGQASIVQEKPEAEPVKAAAQHQLGASIRAPDAGHHPAADLRCNYIRHEWVFRAICRAVALLFRFRL